MIDEAVPPRFEGIDNFRDFGGYATADGRRVKSGRLYRSAHHGRATEGDLTALAALKLAAIVDLRCSDERTRDPSRRAAPLHAAALHVIENDIDQSVPDGYHAFLHTGDLSVQGNRAFLLDYYAAAPFEPRHIDLYTRHFQVLAQADGAVLIHCAAGKDRTGILAALTHRLLGVSHADTLADFLRTNDPDRIARRTALFSGYVLEMSGRRPSDAFVQATLGVEEIFLDAAIASIQARCGSIDAYLEQVLRVDARRKGQIIARLVA